MNVNYMVAAGCAAVCVFCLWMNHKLEEEAFRNHYYLLHQVLEELEILEQQSANQAAAAA